MIPYGGRVRAARRHRVGRRPGNRGGTGPQAAPFLLRQRAVIGVRDAGILDGADAAGNCPAPDAGRLAELVAELSGARLWLPLPAGQKPVTDGSAIALPVIRYGTDCVPAFTSVQRLGTWGDPRTMRSSQGGPDAPVRSGDPVWVHDLTSGNAIVGP